ncbi:MAG: YdcF family protein [Candidatus Pacearchaeota archaeon]
MYDAIVVLSGDEETTFLRIKKALELFHKQGGLAKLVLNGFNTTEAHDPGFEGDWRNDPRLEPFKEKIEKIPDVDIIYARTTEENAYTTAEKYSGKRLAIVTSKSHVKRAKRIFRQFFPDYLDLHFYSSPEPNEKKRRFKEFLARIVTWLELYNLPRGCNEEVFKKICYRKSKYEPLNEIIKKTLKI